MSSVVNLWVTSPDTHSERRFDPHITVSQLKGRLELITGIPTSNQILSLLESPEDPKVVAELTDESKALGYYGVKDFQVIKVVDTNPATSFTGQLTDVSHVEKFELSKEDYEKRQDTVLAYKQRNKIGRFAPGDAPHESSSSQVGISVGSRCEVESAEAGLNKRGTVRFVGETTFGTGIWVGVEYDEPFGKNDGSVKGERYFSCKSNYGVFVRPEKLEVGDFPVEEINFEDEDEEM